MINKFGFLNLQQINGSPMKFHSSTITEVTSESVPELNNQLVIVRTSIWLLD